MPIEGKALFHGAKENILLQPNQAYLLINSSSESLEMLPNTRYYHMYIDFRTSPTTFNTQTLELDLSNDFYFMYLLKAIQALIQENIVSKHRFAIIEQRDTEMHSQVQSLLQVMITHLDQRYKICADENPKIESAIKYIHENYSRRICNEDIATELHIDTRYLIRLFTKYMGMPPYQYLTQYRIERGLELMRNGKTVTETAFLCGYQSENAFRIAFKRVMGCSPKAYLRQ